MKNKPEIKVVTAADAKKLIEQNKQSRINRILSDIAFQAAKGRNQVHIDIKSQKPYVYDALKKKGFKVAGTLVKW
jgi:hypothetical protein